MRRLWLFLCCLVWTASALAAEPLAIPQLSARVTDLTATLSPEQVTSLDTALEKIEHDKGAQVAILLLPTTQPETIEQFGIRLAESWKIGRWKVSDGAIVIVAKDDHAVRIEVGRGLEGAIPDVVAKRVIAERMTPKFKDGDFSGGLNDGVSALAVAIAGEALPVPAAQPASSSGGAEPYFIFLLLAPIVGSVLRSLLGLFGAALAGVAAGWLAWLLFGSWLAAILAVAVTVLFSYARGGGRGWSAGGRGGWSGGGFPGTPSGGSFSGGGGDFSGGGASGNW
jgi:uncharacterized protein